MSLTPEGPQLEAIDTDEDGTLVNVWADGDRQPTMSIGDAITARHRARTAAVTTMLDRKRRRWPIPRI